ncbi:MAG: hypothetical protein HRT52_06345 [Colwellia sp.]|nr:hypothetical protein [Colwellia sp.]
MIKNVILIFLLICLLVSPVHAGKKHCQPYLKKLHTIQSLQRQGHSLKSSNSLNKRENKARDKWWQCEQGKLPVKRKNKSKKKNKVKKSKINPLFDLDSSDKKITPFATQKSLTFKGRFQGDKQFSWLKYYQQPKVCIRPKTTKKFAYCMENKLEQQSIFEKEYGVNN